jgi:hypothetical protein
MAQKIETVTGIVADANYPKGYKIADDSTVIGEKLNQDIVQFFQKLMKEAGLTANGLDDNEVNGSQFVEALYGTIKKPSEAWKEVGNDGGATTLEPGFTQSGIKPLQYKRDNAGNVLITGSVSANPVVAGDIFTLPVEYQSSGELYVTVGITSDKELLKITDLNGTISIDPVGTPPAGLDVVWINIMIPA